MKMIRNFFSCSTLVICLKFIQMNVSPPKMLWRKIKWSSDRIYSILTMYLATRLCSPKHRQNLSVMDLKAAAKWITAPKFKKKWRTYLTPEKSLKHKEQTQLIASVMSSKLVRQRKLLFHPNKLSNQVQNRPARIKTTSSPVLVRYITKYLYTRDHLQRKWRKSRMYSKEFRNHMHQSGINQQWDPKRLLMMNKTVTTNQWFTFLYCYDLKKRQKNWQYSKWRFIRFLYELWNHGRWL